MPPLDNDLWAGFEPVDDGAWTAFEPVAAPEPEAPEPVAPARTVTPAFQVPDPAERRRRAEQPMQPMPAELPYMPPVQMSIGPDYERMADTRGRRIDTMNITDQDGRVQATARLPLAGPLATVQAPPEFRDPQDYTRPIPRDYAALGTLGRMGDQLRSGVETLRQSAAGLGLGGIYDELDALARLERGQVPDVNDMRRPVPIAAMSPEQRTQYRMRLEESAGRKLAEIVTSQNRQQLLARNPRAAGLVEAVNQGRYADAWRMFTADPAGITQQFAVESAPMSAAMMLPGLGAGVIAGRAAGTIATFLGSYGTEAGSRQVEAVMDALRERGVDVSDERAVAGFLRTDPAIAVDAARQAAAGALGPAAFDVATLGGAAGIRRGAGIVRNAARVGRNTGLELLGEPGGEAAGQILERGSIHSPGELVAELLGAGPQVVGSTAYGTLMEAREAAPQPGLGGVSAQPPMPSGLPTFPMTGAPIPPAAPAAAAPAAPASQPASTPPAGQGSAPPQAVPTAPQFPGVEPGAGAAPPPPAPQAAAPGAPPAVVAPAPPAHINPAPVALEQMLQDPRTVEQIQADEAAAAAAALQQAQQAMPQGWQVQQQDGDFILLDPHGNEMQASTAAPTPQLLDQWRNLAERANASGVYNDVLREGEGTRAAPVVAQRSGDVDHAASQASTAPSPQQAAAGNYQKGHLQLHGLDIAIETPRGATRSGVGPDGRPWSVQMPAHYGYVKGTTGRDGDQVDVYLGPEAENPKAWVYVVDQVDADSSRFDEHKAMLGFPSQTAARAAYYSAFNDGRGPQRLGAITGMSLDEFRAWLASGQTKQPLKRAEIAQGIRARRAAEAQMKKAAAEARAAEEKARTEADAAEKARLGREAEYSVLIQQALRDKLVSATQAAASQAGLKRKIEAGGPTEDDLQYARQAVQQLRAMREAAKTETSKPAAEAPAATPEVAPKPEGKPEPVPEPAQADQAKYGTPSAPNLAGLAQAFADALRQGRQFATIAHARTFAAQLVGGAIEPGTDAAKVLEEAVELGVVIAARAEVKRLRGQGPKAVYAALRRLYERQPRLGTRTSGSVERQAYSTPAPLAWVASTLAGITPSTTVLEPTAGTGMLLIGASPDKATVNEIDDVRADALQAQGFYPSSLDAADGEEADFSSPKVDVVIANPPFGAVRDENGRSRRFDLGFVQPGYETGEIDHAIALRALEGMKDDGAAVLLLGGIAKTVTDPEKRADAYNGKAKREFFYTLYQRYGVVRHFTVAGELYAKQGAGWPVDVIVIRGRRRSELPLPSQQAPQVYRSWDALEAQFDGTGDLARPGVGTPGAGSGDGGRSAAAGGSEVRADAVDVPGPAGEARPGDGAVGAGSGTGGGRPGGRAGSPRAVAGRDAGGRVGADAGGASAGPESAVAGLHEPDGAAAGGRAVPGAAGAGGAANPAGHDAGRVDEPGVPADGRSDLDALFDEVLEEEFGGAAQPNPKSEPVRQPAATRRSTGQVAASAAINTGRGIADIAAAIESILLPQGGKLGSLPIFDPEQYQRVLPLMREAVQHFRDAWGDVKELMRRVVQALTAAIPAERRRTFAEALRPYITRFAGEVQAGTVQLEEAAATPEAAPAAEQEAAPAPREPRKPREVDQETDRQVAYNPRADADGVGTLVPINMQTAVERSLANAEQRAGKPLVDFVAERLGYSADEVRRYFSAEQIDALALGIQNLDDEAGFVIGDQTGVGKGRFVAAMIRYALKQKLIPVFVTEKPNLYRDMARDLTDIGMPGVLQQILPTNAGMKLPLTDDEDGPKLRTRDAKVHNQLLEGMSTNDLVGNQKIVFTTYSQMQQIGQADTARIKFLRRIAPRAFLILDESHNAGGAAQEDGFGGKAEGTDRGTLFRNFLREARAAVYSSATWAKRPDVMDLYGIKTDMRLAVPKLEQLAAAIQAGGVPMQQIVSAMLAEAGQYIRRERSFAGVTYELEPITVDRETYEKVARAMAAIFKVSAHVRSAAKELDKEAKGDAKRISIDNSTGGAGVESSSFGAVMHNLINQMLLASKAPGTVRLALDRLKAGEKPVIALANTMGSFIKEYAEENNVAPGDRVDLDFNALLLRYLRKSMELRIRKPFMKKGDKVETRVLLPEELGEEGEAAYREAEQIIDEIDLTEFPLSPIDFIRAELAKAGYRVGEITGRTETVDYRADGGVYYRRRPMKETSPEGKLDAIRRFNGGTADKPLPAGDRLDVMILNQSGATGLSLHANRTFGDQSKRVMLIAQAEANIDTHMQMLGRVHRTGQVVPPEYLQLVADVPAEKRPAAVLAKKMASLSAATTSNRRGTLGAENTPDFLNEYGDQVVHDIVSSDRSLWTALGEPELEKEGVIDDVARRVSGRIPLLPLAQQEALYERIEKAYRRAVELADEAGTNTLEAKTLELDAKLLEEKPWTKGEGNRLFAGSSRIGLYDVKKLRQPPALYTIVGRVAASLGRPLDNEAVKEKPRDQLARMLEDMGGATAEDWQEKQIASADAAARRARQALDARSDLSDKARAQAVQRNEDQHARVTSVLRQAAPGKFVAVETLGEDGGKMGTALVLDIAPPKEGNLLAPGNWEMTILYPDGQRDTFSLAGVFTPQNRPQSGNDAGRTSGGVVVQDAAGNAADFLGQVETASRDSREQRWIVTGNLLAGFAKRRGQIVNFYDANDNLLQGIMMPAQFDMAKFEKDALPRFGMAEATDFLRDPAVVDPLVSTADDSLQVTRGSDGAFVISGPASKRGGADLFLDRRLRDAIGADFVQRGDRMRVSFPASRLAAVMERFSQIATSRRQDLISKTPAAKAWLDERGGRATARSGGVTLNAGLPFSPENFRRFFAGLPEVARDLRDLIRRVVDTVLASRRGHPNIDVVEKERPDGLTPLLSQLRLPNRLFRRWPALAALVDQGIEAEERMSIWSKRLSGKLDQILGALKRDGGDREKVMAALLDADANQVDIEKEDVAAAHWEHHSLSAAEARAAAAVNRLLVEVARLVDQHRRAMLPKVVEAKARVWRQMQALMASASVAGPEYQKAYRRRAYLARRIREGKGDLVAQAREVDQINERLAAMRAADPGLQAQLTELREQYDALEARLQATSVRKRKGYFPHKFFGSWRLFEATGEVDEDGKPIRREITSDQGFYDTQEEALLAAREVLQQNPKARLVIEPKMTTFPGGAGGAVLSDAAYGRLRRQLEDAASLSGAELTAMLKGVATTRSRRRLYTPALQRKGAEGFAEDLERVMRTHIAQAVRYVELDKLKWAYVTTTERLGLSPANQRRVEAEGKAEVQRAIAAWFRDVNGGKQSIESQVDSLLQRMGLPLSTVAAFASGFAIGGAFVNPVIGSVMGAYLGYRMARAHQKGGDFPTRTLVGDIASDMTHLKLGALVNIASAMVNLTQTAVNTFPVLGARWTAEGMRRAIPALWSQAVNAATPGRMSTDAILLQRMDITSRYNIQADNPVLVHDRNLRDRLRQVSMLPFESVERLNRAIAFLGAYARAEAGGASPAAAAEAGREVLRRTQFHQGSANRPELLRHQLLRLPLQFKNFMLQQIGFVMGLRGAEIARFLPMVVLVAGMLGLPGLQLLDWLLEALFGVSAIGTLREQVILAGAGGTLAGTAADVLARGLPALLGVDISSRVGLGAGFLPDSGSDLTGPAAGTVKALREVAANNGELVDYLTALGPFGNPLKALEAAANGASITSSRFWSGEAFREGETRLTNPRKRNQTEYHPTTGELVRYGAGFRPLRAALEADQRQIQAREQEQRQARESRVLADAIQARWDGHADRIPEILAAARRDGIAISARRLRQAIEDAEKTRSRRDLERAPRAQRPAIFERQQAIEAR